MSTKPFKKSLVIGLGLIGGSFAKSLKKHQISEQIFAFDTDQDTIDLATAEALIDGGSTNLDLLDQKFDFIVISAPLFAYEEIFQAIENLIEPQTIIIDLGSLKNFIHEILPKKLAANFIGCHPISGSEKSGFENSDDQIFIDKKFVICPKEKTDQKSLEIIKNIITKIGGNFENIDSKKHDEIYALVSHLPQFLSFLTKEFSPKKSDNNFIKTAFRLDDSNPEIWEEIFSLNEENLEKFYLQFFDNLEKEISLIKNIDITQILSCADFSEGFGHNDSESCFDKLSMTSDFFEENFVAIFTRALVVKSYLKLPQIKTYQNYSGSGFRDFSSIIKIFNLDQKILSELIEKNHKKILKNLNSLS